MNYNKTISAVREYDKVGRLMRTHELQQVAFCILA